MKFRKKPVIIEAIQFTQENVEKLDKWLEDNAIKDFGWQGDTLGTTTKLIIHTLEGDMTASPNDWIIKGVQGEFYPCKPDIFQATYEAID